MESLCVGRASLVTAVWYCGAYIVYIVGRYSVYCGAIECILWGVSRAIVGLSGGGGGQCDPVWVHSGSRHWMIHCEGSVASTERPGVWAPVGRGRGEGARGRGSPGTGGRGM